MEAVVGLGQKEYHACHNRELAKEPETNTRHNGKE